MTLEELFLEVRGWTFGPYFSVETEQDLEAYVDGQLLCYQPIWTRHTVVVDGRRFPGAWRFV